jgi:N-acetylglucosamine-6-sulfatase
MVSRRMRGVSLWLAVLVAFGLAGAAGAGPAQTPAKPNIVVVMADDQTVESLRVMTNLRTLVAAEGTTFSNSFASFPLCCPSRSTFLTGQYAHNHTVMGNAMPTGGFEKLDHTNTLPVWLQRVGYRTVHIGKYLNGYGRRSATEIPPGWSEWYGSVDPSTYQFYNYTLNENGRTVRYGADPGSYQADVYTRKAADTVRRLSAGGPFFLSVAYLAPHSGGPRETDDPRNFATPVPAPRHRNRFAAEPLPASPAFNEADMSDKPASMRSRATIGPARVGAITENYRQRLESLLAVDEGVAALVSTLRAVGELENTLIVYTADNGFFHGEHRVQQGKVLHYEPSTRVPLILRGPGIPRGAVRSQLVANIDVAPTILSAAGATAARPVDGRPLQPFARDAQLFSGRDILLETPTYRALRSPRYVYVEHSSNEQELYDLASDPNELASLHASAAHAPLKALLAARLAKLRTCAGGACRVGASLSLRVRYKRARPGCARGPVSVRVGGADATRLSAAHFYAGAKRLQRDRRPPFAYPVARKFLHSTSQLRVVAFLKDSRVATLDWRVRACR